MKDLSPGSGTSAGTYALVMRLTRRKIIPVGKSGPVTFKAGYYVYTGSAFGPGGLSARIGHHLKLSKKCHWHIDYLRRFAEIREIWYTLHPEKVECNWAEAIQQIRRVIIPKPGFGSSDCRCMTHLFHFKKKPGFRTFRKKVTPILRVRKLDIAVAERNRN